MLESEVFHLQQVRKWYPFLPELMFVLCFPLMGNNLYIALCTQLANSIEGTGKEVNINNDTFLLILKLNLLGLFHIVSFYLHLFFLACLLFLLT